MQQPLKRSEKVTYRQMNKAIGSKCFPILSMIAGFFECFSRRSASALIQAGPFKIRLRHLHIINNAERFNYLSTYLATYKKVNLTLNEYDALH